jgi:hypothetical protein
MSSNADCDWQEALRFRPGRKVELKRQPGIFDTIASYDSMMVPPVSLVNDPIPRYPEELRLVCRPFISIRRLNQRYQLPTRYQARNLRDRANATPVTR